MTNEQEKVQKVIALIEESALDQTIKSILIRDLKTEGLTDFLREQIKAYCIEGIKEIDERVSQAKKILDEHNDASDDSGLPQAA